VCILYPRKQLKQEKHYDIEGLSTIINEIKDYQLELNQIDPSLQPARVEHLKGIIYGLKRARMIIYGM